MKTGRPYFANPCRGLATLSFCCLFFFWLFCLFVFSNILEVISVTVSRDRGVDVIVTWTVGAIRQVAYLRALCKKTRDQRGPNKLGRAR